MTTTPSARAREAAADVLDEISELLSHDGIGQVADLIRDGEYDEHDVMPIFARFEAAIRADQMKRDAQIGYVACAETRHVKLGDAVRAAILAQMENSDEG